MNEYIDKKAADNALTAAAVADSDKKRRTWAKAIGVLHDIPAADVAPVVHAKWENCDWVEPYYHGCGTIRIPNAGMKCTNCVHVFKKDLLWKDNYCPNCGAKMDLEE
ncbi:hypothetical protein [Negativibacillus massiliensis]|uniref:hypothetical protein n=1 Tax=Negativibacillus massiliensis TaxID=1871035 RepID=UPI003AF22B46